jgi:signal transduction histidine kinase
MSPRKKARLAFASALILLLVCGTAATITIVQLMQSAKWIAHTYDVQVALGELQTVSSIAARSRTGYLNSGDPSYLPEYEKAKTQLHRQLTALRDLTKDNASQMALFNQLEDLTLRRLELLDTSIEIRKSGPLDEATQLRLSRENVSVATNFMDVIEKMMQEERGLLAQRREVSSNLFVVALGILLAMLVLAILLFWIHFRLLENELAERERTEENARRLSGRILHLQDEERRKFSRELHDSLGQLLAMAKMHLFELQERNPKDDVLAQMDRLLDQSITETRTISHLLHPPLLDEIGLASAFRWYLEGFGQRSGVKVTTDVAEDIGRLPRPVELALFRVLQESLTNIHRHSKSERAEVSLGRTDRGVILRIRDFGKGIPADTLRSFLRTGTRVGVGLAGMRERVREQGGQLGVQSDGTGTTITVTMPPAAIEPRPELEAAILPDSVPATPAD